MRGAFYFSSSREGDDFTITPIRDDDHITGKPELFTLIFQVLHSGQLKDMLSVNSRYTQAEAYDQAGEMLGVTLTFKEYNNMHDEFSLWQNVPNPWSDKTVIGFYLPRADQVTLTIHDGQRRKLKIVRSDFEAGNHEFELKRSEIPASGVLYYTLQSGEYAAVRKMILLE